MISNVTFEKFFLICVFFEHQGKQVVLSDYRYLQLIESESISSYFEVSEEITFVQADDKFHYIIDEETNYRRFRIADSFIRRNRYDIFTKEFFENYSL
jgi:hypothetical protein